MRPHTYSLKCATKHLTLHQNAIVYRSVVFKSNEFEQTEK